MNRTRAPHLLFALLTALASANEAHAIMAHSDCAEWAGTGLFGGWVYIEARATLQENQSGVWVDLEDVDDTVFMDSAGSFLLSGAWVSTGLNGSYRAKLVTTAYFGGSGSTPPTPSELASWPSQNKMTSTEYNSGHGCATGGPLFTSTPPGTGSVAVTYTYDPTVSYGGNPANLSYSRMTGPAAMTMHATTGHVEWTPDTPDVGTKYVILRVAALGLVDIQAYAIEVADNSPPIAEDDSYETDEDAPLEVLAAQGVLANDTEPQSTSMTAILVEGPNFGALTLYPDGAFDYEPEPNYHGTDSFTYLATDGTLDSEIATVTITIDPVHDAIVAVDDAWEVREDTPIAIPALAGVLANDFNPDQRPLTASLISGPSHGTFDLESDGSYTYEPDAEYSGTDAIVYQATDGTETSNATLTFDVVPVNDAPVAVDDAYELDQNQILDLGPELGLLANDSDAEDDPVVIIPLTLPSQGHLTIDALGGLTFVPIAGVSGSEGFDYLLADQESFSNIAHVDFEIAPVDPPQNQAPYFTSFPVLTTLANVEYTYPVLTGDPDEDEVTVTLQSGPSGMVMDGDTLEWTPTTPGTYAVVLQADDGNEGLATQSFELEVVAAGQPDLIVSAIDTTDLETQATTLVTTGSIFVTVTNIGGSLLDTELDVTMFRDTNGNGVYNAGVDEELGTERYEGPLTSQSDAIVEVPVSFLAAFRDELLYAFADSAAEVAESDELNNVRDSGVSSQYVPPAGDASPTVRWYYETPTLGIFGPSGPTIVAPLIDTNEDDLINERDIPAVIFVANHQSSSTWALHALRGDTGELIFAGPSPSGTCSNLLEESVPAVGDLDGDGTPEIAVHNAAGSAICAFDNAGSLLWSAAVPQPGSQLVLADLDGNGAAEIVGTGRVINADGSTAFIAPSGGLYPSLNSVAGHWPTSSFQVADLDLDGVPEIVAGASAHDNTGQRVWAWRTADPIGGVITAYGIRPDASEVQQTVPFSLIQPWTAVGNVDDDPEAEVVAVTYGATNLWIFEHDGTIKAVRQLFPPSNYLTLGSPTIADADGDGIGDVIIPATNRTPPHETTTIVLTAHRVSDGATIWSRDMNPGASINNGAPVVTSFDFDGDGALELVYSDTQRVTIMEIADASTRYELAVDRVGNGAYSAIYVTIADVDHDGSADLVVTAPISHQAGAPSRHGILVISDTRGNWRPGRGTWNQFKYQVTNVNDDGSIPAQPMNHTVLGHGNFVQHTPPARLFSAPDLSIARVLVDTSSCPTSYAVTTRVGNAGSRFAGPGQTVRAYDGVPGQGGVLLGSGKTTEVLYPGEFEDVVLTLDGGPPAQVFATVNDGAPNAVVSSGNLGSANIEASSAAPKHAWTAGSGRHPSPSTLVSNGNAYKAIDGNSTSFWEDTSDEIWVEEAYFEVHFPFPVSVDTVSIDSAAAHNGFGGAWLEFGGLDYLPTGFQWPFLLDANGNGNETFTAQDEVTWVRLQGDATGLGPKVAEMVVGGSYRPPIFMTQEGAGLYANNTAASEPEIPSCGSADTPRPLITSVPPVRATAGQEYSYTPTATGDAPLTLSLQANPQGMSLVSGSVLWTPTTEQGGVHTVTIRVTDGNTNPRIVEQTYQVFVTAPSVQVTVPDVIGLTQQGAEAALSAAGLVRGGLAEASSPTMPQGSVLSQAPGSGSIVAPGTAVNIVLSSGSLETTVPDLIGDNISSVDQQLAIAGLTRGTVDLASSTLVPAGVVLAQTPLAEATVPRGSAVDVEVSAGDVGVVPDLVGLTRVQAFSELGQARLRLGSTTYVHHATAPTEEVLAQTPAPNTLVAYDSSVDLTLSLGPAPVDGDSDGWLIAEGDCDDGDPNIYPGATDTPGDAIDQNCNGVDSIAGDTTAPTVELTSPVEDEVITAPVSIIGTADDENFLRYELSIGIAGTEEFFAIGEGDQPSTGGVLGTLDPTLLENGIYELKIEVEDANGQTSETIVPVQIDGGMKIGVFTLSFTDLAIPVSGIPITVTRTYDSRVKTKHDFGIGWKLDVAAGRYTHNRVPGKGWQITQTPGAFHFPCSVVNELSSHRTEVRLSDREYYTFALSVIASTWAGAGGCTGIVGFVPIGGSAPGATLEILGDDTIIQQSGTTCAGSGSARGSFSSCLGIS